MAQAAQPPAAKKPRLGNSASLVDLTTARNWDHSGGIFGLHAGATAAHLSAAKRLAKDHGAIHCNDCGARLGAHKTTWKLHYEGPTCVSKRANAANSFNPAILMFAVVNEPRNKPDELRVRQLLCSSLVAAGMTPSQQAVVFQRGSAELTALASFASTGLPSSRATTSEAVSGGAAIVRRVSRASSPRLGAHHAQRRGQPALGTVYSTETTFTPSQNFEFFYYLSISSVGNAYRANLIFVWKIG
jgi:hypothetical protein